MTLKNLQIDHYPFHRACVGRDHWLRYQEPNGDRVPWLEEIHNNYARKVFPIVLVLYLIAGYDHLYSIYRNISIYVWLFRKHWLGKTDMH